jgi:poly(hydroxyalkanoate) depolymerase family esterase
MRLEFDGLNIAGGGGRFGGSLLVEQAEFGDNPEHLRMFHHVPAGLAAGAPLVVILHGCLQTARGYDHGTGWSALAERFGFALLAPEQARANNPNGCFNWFLPEQTARGRGEVASIRQMTAWMLEAYALDPSRVFVTGLSAGGAMAGAMLATYPELFAAGAIIAGLPYGAAGNVLEALAAMHHTQSRPAGDWGDAVRHASAHAGPWPRISVWHGDADTTVASSNMDAIVAQWRDVHGLAQPPLEVHEPGYVRRIWRDTAEVPVIEAYTMRGLGHGVPIHGGGGEECCGEAGPFLLEAGISSSHRIADFFGLTATLRPGAQARPSTVDTHQTRTTDLHGLSGGRLHQVIVGALKAAGLMRD